MQWTRPARETAGRPTTVGKTFELVAEHGPASKDFDVLFAPLAPDFPDLDAVRHTRNMPLAQEPERLRQGLRRPSQATERLTHVRSDAPVP